jgi:hypothetical protein
VIAHGTGERAEACLPEGIQGISSPYDVYPSIRQAFDACMAFVGDHANVAVIPCDDPQGGLCGVSAWYTQDAQEVSRIFFWPIKGTKPLTPVTKECKSLGELDLPVGKFYPADNPMTRKKGWVYYDWESGQAITQEVPIKYLRGDPNAQDLLKVLDQESRANAEKLFGGLSRRAGFIGAIQGYLKGSLIPPEDFRFLLAIDEATQQAETP